MITVVAITLLFHLLPGQTDVREGHEINPWVELSMQYLYRLRDDRQVNDVLRQLKKADMGELVESLDTHEEKLAFWINIYNAHVITLLREDPTYFENRDVFFRERDIMIAGVNMSLDEIEHGILRDSRIKWALGYLEKWFELDWIRILRMDQVDERIHFALNCGALDCPDVGIYNELDVNWQLDQMTEEYLRAKTDVSGSVVTTTPLFSWFRGDFGGKTGVRDFLVRYNIIEDHDVTLKFFEYDWTMKIGQIEEIRK